MLLRPASACLAPWVAALSAAPRAAEWPLRYIEADIINCLRLRSDGTGKVAAIAADIPFSLIKGQIRRGRAARARRDRKRHPVVVLSTSRQWDVERRRRARRLISHKW
jgi:hypothetical protein